VQFGREVCGNLDLAEQQEWLVTNGLGGYASGTVAGTTTRRYHGLLIAALEPPGKRTMLVNAIDDSVRYLESTYSLATNRWMSGSVSPRGYLQIESFHLEGSKPVWRYALGDALLEKRIWMQQGEDTTYVQYTLLRASAPIELEGKVLVSYREFHSTMRANEGQMQVDPVEHGLRIVTWVGATPIFLVSAAGQFTAERQWYRDFFLPAEHERGLDDHEDRLYAARFNASLQPGESLTIVLSTNSNAILHGEHARSEQAGHDMRLFQDWQAQHTKICASSVGDEPGWLWQLVLAADQFIVNRSFRSQPEGKSVIAGYPWFSDWGRDTMIALPGLTLAVGRPHIARDILRSYARFVDQGMLPNHFPDAGEAPEYNTADATLWFFEAARKYFEATQDFSFVHELFPTLASVIDAHVEGTRYNIKVDPADALLYSGVPGVQLTWMDAKIGDWVVTPRTGKAIEVNALWINALHTMANFAHMLLHPSDGYERLAEKATHNFQKFWNHERHCCFDVIDIPSGGSDAALRPNQIFAVALPVSPLSVEQQKGIVDMVAQHLLTSHGLRSLAPSEPEYKGHYGGSPRQRDSAYHQGTVWGWLLGPFAVAHYRVYGAAAEALSFLEPLGRTVTTGGLGTLGEIFDGDAPFAPAGCIAQAWTVGEVFSAWQSLSAASSPEQMHAAGHGQSR
jgi:predicted glycogen debranching enzyme